MLAHFLQTMDFRSEAQSADLAEDDVRAAVEDLAAP